MTKTRASYERKFSLEIKERGTRKRQHLRGCMVAKSTDILNETTFFILHLNFGKVNYSTVLKKERSYNANLFGLHQSAIMVSKINVLE